MKCIARLTGTVKHYDWGGTRHIPTLLHRSNPSNIPFAEYWLGIHPLSDCRVEFPGEEPELLRDFINRNPQTTLGEKVYRQFGNLPYLLKTLDVKDMLSIQVHPSKAAAEKEFARENAAGIPADAPNRNYRDANHKPELVLALSGFWLLHGFKTATGIRETLQRVKELEGLLASFEKEGYAGLYKKVMEMPQGEVNRLLRPLLDRILPLYHDNKLEKISEDFWAARAALTYNRDHSIDRGIFSIYLFNLLHIQKGEAVFQDAGIPHAYLEGLNVEIMSNSDNVLRGGLTNKHVDVGELLKHVKFEATPYKILKGTREPHGELVYHTSAPDFELGCFELAAGQQNTFQSSTADILLLTEGEVEVSCDDQRLQLRAGEPAALVLPGAAIILRAIRKSLVFRATVPVHTRE